jgi:hypothetical protein
VKTPRVLILQENSLLSHALNSILRGSNAHQLKMVTSEAKDFTNLVLDISELDPDYVLLEESGLATSKNQLIDLLKIYPGLRVIVISEESNLLHIYQNRDMLLTRPEDLLMALSSNEKPEHQD